MDRDQRQRSSIAKELMTWADALPRILAKIDDVLKLPNITIAQAKEIESIANTVGAVFVGIREAARADDYDRLMAGVDRLREEIMTADAVLDRLIKPS
jgi:hypothetical protein